MENSTYELAFLIIQTLDEEAIQAETKAIEDLIGQHGGFVLHSKKPEKRHLSYPIRHQSYAFFGFINFTASAEKLTKITEQLKLDKNILRSMVLKKDQKVARPSSTSETESVAKPTEKSKVTRTRKPKAESKDGAEPAGKLDVALDNALDKIDINK